jgi:broad specificity phosphatase PhoE
MSELFLIRHGQASFGAADYDELSELGYRQARWLGEYFRERDLLPQRVLGGTLKRHRQTLDAIAEGLQARFQVETDAGWNECDFQALVAAYAEQYPEDGSYDPAQPKTYYRVMKKALLAWSEQRLHGALPESWAQFQARVTAALRNVQTQPQHRTVFAVSSSGAIAAALMQIMRFGADTHVDLYLQARNTGINHLFFNSDTVKVSGFNYVPHLDRPDRRAAVSFI